MLRMSYSDHFLSVIHLSVSPSAPPSVCLLTISNDNSFKAIEAICPLLSKNVAWLGAFKSSENYGDLPLGLVTMVTESSHRLIMGK